VADFLGAVSRWGFCHFQDTSEAAPIRRQCYKEDNRSLQPDAGNLAAYLYLLRETARPYYDRIVRTVQLAFPEFDDFDVGPLELNPRNVMLNWREVGRDKLFGPHDLSDGTLRFMALATLLLQPEERLPELILIDEPELGLHPSAMELLGGMLRSAAALTQVIVATQSVRLVDEFDPEDIVVTERWEGATAFRRLDPGPLAGWLEDYSIGELWEKNVVGGRP
jgi:predicted ATPase